MNREDFFLTVQEIGRELCNIGRMQEGIRIGHLLQVPWTTAGELQEEIISSFVDVLNEHNRGELPPGLIVKLGTVLKYLGYEKPDYYRRFAKAKARGGDGTSK